MVLLLSLLSAAHAEAQQPRTAMPFVVMEYNCENLFDCRHDTLKDDYSFLPDGDHEWTFPRYWKKLNDIARVIHQCGGNYKSRHLPDIVAMVEVENDSVMRMLTRASMLREAGYRYVMTNSPDERGIDVAMLYNPLTFKLLSHHSIRLKLMKGQSPTRDILYAEGLMRNSDTLHVFTVHAPSRSGGAYQTGRYRRAVSGRLIDAIDSIRTVHRDAKIVIAGDFNDYFFNKSLEMLQNAGMTNISAKAHGRNAQGTYKHDGQWNSLDHILLSPALLDKVKFCKVHDPSWLLQVDNAGGYKPRRTFLGNFYNHGVSDHLPLLLRMEFEYLSQGRQTVTQITNSHKNNK